MTPLLYPERVQSHDVDIADKLHGLTRDSGIVLLDGTTIPYWQTLQYANRNMRMFITRIREGNMKGKDFDHIPDKPDRTIIWELSSLLRKLLVTDCVKHFIENDKKYPNSFTGFGKKNEHRGKKFSGSIFYNHLEADRRGSFIRLGELKKASAVATGDGITFNNAKRFSERSIGTAVAIMGHEQTHNMGYPHKDRAPNGVQAAVQKCFKKKAHKYTTYDLTKTPDFNTK